MLRPASGCLRVRTLSDVRIFFTGGSGKAGRWAIRHLVEQGHRVVNGDLVPLGDSGVADLRVDLTDAGQVFNALSAYAGFDDSSCFATFCRTFTDTVVCTRSW